MRSSSSRRRSVSVNDQSSVFTDGPEPGELAEQIVEKASPGEIILLHDGHGTDHNNDKSDASLTVEALPLVIQGLLDKGYRFVTVPEMLNSPAYNEGAP